MPAQLIGMKKEAMKGSKQALNTPGKQIWRKRSQAAITAVAVNFKSNLTGLFWFPKQKSFA